MNKWSFLLILLTPWISGGDLHAQRFYVKVSGKVTDHFTGDPLRGVKVRLLKAGQEESDLKSRPDGTYEFTLDRGWRYAIWYSQDGFITKHINIDTEEMPPYPDVPFFEMDVQMTLFEWIPDFDFSLFDLALGEASYKQSVRNMSWDVQYTEFMRPSLAKVMDEYEKTYKGYYKRNKGRIPPKVTVPMAMEDSTRKGTGSNRTVMAPFTPGEAGT